MMMIGQRNVSLKICFVSPNPELVSKNVIAARDHALMLCCAHKGLKCDGNVLLNKLQCIHIQLYHCDLDESIPL